MHSRLQVRGNPSDDAACAGCLLLDHLVRYQKGKRRHAVRAADVHDVLVPLWLHKADAAKAELHQELVEACRRLSEMHNRCTVLEVENATLVSHNRELDERLRGESRASEPR